MLHVLLKFQLTMRWPPCWCKAGGGAWTAGASKPSEGGSSRDGPALALWTILAGSPAAGVESGKFMKQTSRKRVTERSVHMCSKSSSPRVYILPWPLIEGGGQDRSSVYFRCSLPSVVCAQGKGKLGVTVSRSSSIAWLDRRLGDLDSKQSRVQIVSPDQSLTGLPRPFSLVLQLSRTTRRLLRLFDEIQPLLRMCFRSPVMCISRVWYAHVESCA